MDERVRIMLDATPMVVQFWDENLNVIDCNQTAVTMYNLSDKQEYIDRYFDLTPEFQPDGSRSFDKLKWLIDQAYKEGYQKFEWMRRSPDGEPIPVDVTLVRIKHNEKNLVVGYCRDLREQKRMMQQVEERDHLLQVMLDATPLVAQFWDENLKVIECNQAAVKMFNLSSKQEYIDRYFELAPKFQPDGQRSFDLLKKLIDKAYKEGYQKFEWMRQSLDGEPIPVENTLVRVNYKGKDLVIGYCRDLREQKRMLQEINDTAAQLKAVVANYPGVICSADKNHKVTLFDGLLVPHLISKDRFFKGQDLRVALENDALKHILGRIGKTLSEGAQEWSFEANGKALHMSTTPIFDDKNEATGLVAKIDDITEMTRIQKELKAALERAEAAVLASEMAHSTAAAMFEANPHINVLFDSALKIIDCNPAALKFFEFETKEELLAGLIERITASIPAIQPSGRISIPLAKRLMTAVKEGFVKFETELIMGAVRRNLDVEFKKIPYKDSFAIVCYIYDMTDIHEREMELAQAHEETERQRAEAEAANKAKSSFLSTMSHEIRTPMNAIIGITEILLQDEKLDHNIRESLDKIYTSSDILLGIINDILDLSKIEAGRLELLPAKYEIASLVNDTATLNMMRIGSKPIEFELSVDENMPFALIGDELRIKQILNNLLSNAFKYTEKGTVRMSVSAEAIPGTDHEVTLVVSVSDTGQGMSEEQLARLFDEYARFNTEANRSTEGTGLGMSITQNLIRLMNGKITIESQPDKGSTFTVYIPQNKNGFALLGREMAENLCKFRTGSKAQMKRVQITREPMPYGSVLIVDDVETNIYVARGLLSPYGLKIDSVNSGFAAIEKIENGHIYDIVFMDHMMPGMDGIEATALMRDKGYTHPIVALTANAVSGQADTFLGNGFDDFISKPIDIRQLNAVLNRLIRDKQPPEVLAAARKQAGAVPPSADGPKPSVDPLLAEIFMRDAGKALAILESIIENGAYHHQDALQTYIINVHGMKSALANIGTMELSAAAMELEAAGREGNFERIAFETPAFLDSLRTFIEEIIPRKKAGADGDQPYLREKLLVIKTACETYDQSAADEALAALREKSWPRQTEELLSTISEQLLHSDFEEIADEINHYTKTL
ncbi:MAG: ATP-binding protein [Oscillospiraceae bacterium]|nr:ATP-binding protein [Oscillospiraceae bacterium]